MVWVIKKMLGWVGLGCDRRIGQKVHDAEPDLAQQQRKAGRGAAIVRMGRGWSRIALKEV